MDGLQESKIRKINISKITFVINYSQKLKLKLNSLKMYILNKFKPNFKIFITVISILIIVFITTISHGIIQGRWQLLLLSETCTIVHTHTHTPKRTNKKNIEKNINVIIIIIMIMTRRINNFIICYLSYNFMSIFVAICINISKKTDFQPACLKRA